MGGLTPERRPGVSPPARPTLIYDGECGFCRQSVDIVRRWDEDRRLDYVPFQDRAAVARLGIPLPALAAAMHLVLPDGRAYAGADAAPEIVRAVGTKRWLWVLTALLYATPGVRPLARRVYAWIAARRRCAVRGLPAPRG